MNTFVKSADMNTKSTKKKNKEKSWVLPGGKFTHKEFIDGVKKAEEGSFMTVEEFKSRFHAWRSEKYK